MAQASTQRKWYPSRLEVCVSEIAKRTADREAARIPWPQLLKTRELYVKWQVFLYWVRAIEESERLLPEWLAHVVKRRCPGFEEFLSRQRTKEPGSPQPAWRHLEQWINEHNFAKPRREGWMNAVGYYAVRDLAALRDDAYWFYRERQWEQSQPAAYPSFQEWRKASESCGDELIDHFETTEEVRELLRLSRLVRPRTLRKTVDRYIEWQLFAYWTRAALDPRHRLPDAVKRKIRRHCPGFLESIISSSGSHTTGLGGPFNQLQRWIEEHEFARPRKKGWLPVLIYQARIHPRHQRLIDYWQQWQHLLSKRPPDRYPSFRQWTAAVDAYTFEPEGS
jgi:hypothetical protein